MKKRYIFLTAIFGFINAFAMPTNPVVVSGEMTSKLPETNKMHLTVSDKAIVNWESFSIELGNRVKFIQPNEMSAVLNRVTGNMKSEILGVLEANGHVFLINPQGIIVGKDARIETGAFLGSTLDIADQDFLDQNFLFKGAGVGDIINYGFISTNVGSVTLLGRKVENHCKITSKENFTVALAEEVLLQNDQDNRVYIRAKLLDDENTGFSNLGKITAIRSEIQASNNPYSYAINLEGEITNPSVDEKGKFYLKAEGAKIVVAGKLNQNEITISGQEIKMTENANIHAGNKGVIALDATDQITTNGICRAPSGNISMVKQEKDTIFFHHGTFDVSAPTPGKIYLYTTKLLNTGKLLADSNVEKGGDIRIEALKIIDVEKATISANGEKRGGKIQVLGAERLSTSGRYLATGKEKGGCIQARSNNLIFISPYFDVSSEQSNGDIYLEVAENGKYFALSHTKLFGKISNKTVSLDELVKGFEPLHVIKPLQRQQKLLSVIDSFEIDEKEPLFDKKHLTVYLKEQPIGKYPGAKSALDVNPKRVFDDVGAFEEDEDSLTLLKSEKTLLSAPLGAPLLGADVPFSEYDLIDPNSSGGSGFGTHIVPLRSGNIVVTKPNDDYVALDSGAVYLYNGETRALISTLTGNAINNNVGSGGAIALTNGNFVALSPSWDNGGANGAGAATFGNGITGISGQVDATTSLVGNGMADNVGQSAVALTNGNYVVVSPKWASGGIIVNGKGAATFGNGSTGVKGLVTTANSLVGSTNGDQVGSGGVVALPNGNYVVNSEYWNIPLGNTDVGAVTYCHGTTGLPKGSVTQSNSLHGVIIRDNIGSGGVVALPNSNYVVLSPAWNVTTFSRDEGAATFCRADGSTVGPVNSSNSLVGVAQRDNVGSGGCIALANGNYVVLSPKVDIAAATDKGAATFCTANGFPIGPVNASNSLVGQNTGDEVGSSGIVLPNGNYVVISTNWDSGGFFGQQKGAVTWCSGTTGIPYNESSLNTTVNSSNSLVGVTPGDTLGQGGVVALTNSSYVVSSPNFDLGGATNSGAVTWCKNDGSTIGPVTTSNSLYGGMDNDNVGVKGVVALPNGNYVVPSPNVDQAGVPGSSIGAITCADGTTGIVGMIDATNSILGTTLGDALGAGTIPSVVGVTLPTGYYMIPSGFYDNGAITDAGAAYIGSGTCPITGSISSTNSLLGKQAGPNNLYAIAADDVNYSFIASFLNEGAGRVTIAYVPKPPVPPVPFVFTPEIITLINNTTLAARNELFTYLHSFNEYIENYLAYSYREKVPPMKISIAKGYKNRFYLKNLSIVKKWQTRSLFIRLRKDKTKGLMEEKTL